MQFVENAIALINSGTANITKNLEFLKSRGLNESKFQSDGKMEVEGRVKWEREIGRKGDKLDDLRKRKKSRKKRKER